MFLANILNLNFVFNIKVIFIKQDFTWSYLVFKIKVFPVLLFFKAISNKNSDILKVF